MSTNIHQVTRADGRRRWQAIVEAGTHPTTGRRRQVAKTFDRKADAESWVAKMRVNVNEGTLIAPTKITVNEALDRHLRAKAVKVRATTLGGYNDALRPVRAAYGEQPLQALTTEKVMMLRDDMLTRGLSARTVNYTLLVLSAALDRAALDMLIPFNPASTKRVDRPTQQRRDFPEWSVEQARQFLTHVLHDRYYAAWALTISGGLRRSEVLGLTWGAIDFDARVIHVRHGRTVATGTGSRTVIGNPKSKNSRRSIEVDPSVIEALRELRRQQRSEGRWVTDDDLVVVDEIGRPLDPDTYTKWFKAHAKAAGLPPIRLHDARRTAATFMHQQGVPIADAAALLGHNPKVYLETYVNAKTTRAGDATALLLPQAAEGR